MRYISIKNDDYPVTLDHAKEWLDVYHDDDNGLITDIVAAAFTFCEGYTGISFRNQAWELQLSALEASGGFEILKAPISKFIGISATDKKGNAQALPEGGFFITTMETYAIVVITDTSYLINAPESPNAISVNFETNAGMPPHIMTAIKMMCAWQYENRGDAPSINNNSAPPEALKLLQLERVGFV